MRAPHKTIETKSVTHLFVVEGLMDALRLEALGINAVALLGSQITNEQVKLLSDYTRELDRENAQLSVHIFLDADEAGRRGAVNATIKLLEASVEVPGMLLDVLAPPLLTDGDKRQGHDPDELFQEIGSAEAALDQLSEWCYAPMKMLLAAAVDAAPSDPRCSVGEASREPTFACISGCRATPQSDNLDRDSRSRSGIPECHLREQSRRGSALE